MEPCSSALCVLILLTTTFTTVSGADSTEISVNLNDSVTLPCEDRCSGLVTWSQSSSGVVAQCNQTSCLSVKDGFNMSRDQYLKGNLSLIIPVADPSKSGEYTCQCDHKNISNVVLVVSPPSVNVIFHGNAALPCSENCSALATWVRSNEDVVAQCDQTSCQSIKPGFHMIHDQYLKGDLSLYITDADFSMRDTYACQCDGTDYYDVELVITALNSTVQITPGESLVLDVDVLDPVEVLYESAEAGGSSSGQICTVDGRSLQCSVDYKQRVLFSPALELKGMNLSDDGVYTIRDLRTKQDIHVYTVTVRDDPHPPEEQKIVLSVLGLTGIVVGTALIPTVIYSVILFICKRRSSLCVRDCEINDIRGNGQNNQNTEEENILPPDQQ
ncbi:uncharacterized protein LOC108411262 [Pygocentrus nattereri]|uniref:uncharacterized protein LOC108411262 n=1 Tax=Pygocentrus nattereri TaxID=42514 RepID=UPI001891AE7C|nr:uncharacterized protein LOC108411262 [Pygocentrus nattereri]XP_037387451.1 uncharacterized protein LOC108411262 [Pygocentrus nattereri]XP_037387452.1 uncharacterized protein LOC108411262 [Pygocentrus nattereri]XP_037387453.1 uncharacterized protein LOC108411262 [Pygocentrus nattereri]